MNEFTLQAVIRHAQKIEQESYAFYTGAGPRVADPVMKALVGELAEAEVEHFNRLRGLLEESRLSAQELASRVSFEEASLDMLVPVRPLPEDGSARDILTVALERERNTRGLYQRLLAFTNLPADLAETFEYLMAQETGHVRKIEARLKKV